MAENLFAEYLAEDLDDATRRSIRIRVDRALEVLDPNATPETYPWGKLRREDVVRVQQVLKERFAPSTVDGTISTIKALLRRARRANEISADEYARARDVEKLAKAPRGSGRALSEPELRRLLDAAFVEPTRSYNELSQTGDRAMVAVLGGAGLRVSEAIQVTRADLIRTEDELIGLRVREEIAKGGLGYEAILDAWAAQILEDEWFPSAAESLWGRPPLVGAGPDARVLPFAASTVTERLAALSRRAEIEKVTPHDLRRTHITLSIARGSPPDAVARAHGHRSTRLTLGLYDRRSAEQVAGQLKR